MSSPTDLWLFPRWSVPCQVHAVVTLRDGPGLSRPPFGRFNLGCRGGERQEVVLANRQALIHALDLPSVPRWLSQVHGCAVAELDNLPVTTVPQADAAVSRLAGTVLAILTADCLPVLFCSDDGRTLAAAHAGWRGLAAGVLKTTVESMRIAPTRVTAWLGPCIGAVSYEVDEAVRSVFVDQAPVASTCFTPTRSGYHWYCDLVALARQQLAELGLAQVTGGGFDTFVDPRFYSFRREGACSGRFASLLWQSPDQTFSRLSRYA